MMRAMPRPGPVHLLGTGQPTSRLFREMVTHALSHVQGRAPRVALSLAALAETQGAIRKFLGWFTAHAFGGAQVTRFTVEGEPKPMSADEARAIVDAADLIYLTGGDPVAGARVLTGSGADLWLREARARGAALAGGSAGAILLGAWWAEWPDEPDALLRQRPFDGGSLLRCTGVVPDLVVDTHAEEDAWQELRLVQGLLAAAGHTPRLRGIPTGGGLVVGPDGSLTVVGDPPHLP